MSHKPASLTHKEREILVSVGLSPDSIALYAFALGQKDVSAQEVAAELGTFASAVYRLFYNLETMGLLIAKGGRPLRYASVPKHLGLPASVKMHQQDIHKLLNKQQRLLAQSGPILVIGRQALYDYYEQLAYQAQRQIQAYTIGIAYSESLHKTQSDALKRGVHMQHVVQQVKPANYHVIHKWQRLGIRIRSYSAPRGFHLMIFDETSVLVSFSDAADTDNRVSFYTDNQAVVSFFMNQFRAIWQSAHIISRD